MDDQVLADVWLSRMVCPHFKSLWDSEGWMQIRCQVSCRKDLGTFSMVGKQELPVQFYVCNGRMKYWKGMMMVNDNGQYSIRTRLDVLLFGL